MSLPAVARLAAAIHEVVRGRGAAPPPRPLPYLGLEHPSGTGLHLLDELSARGIFRKYELVLDVEAGLGGNARWLATRLGCEVVATASSADEALAAADLTRRARLTGPVRVASAAPDVLPFPDGRFTHVWMLEALPRLADPATALAEAHRVVRRGGTLAVQDLVLGTGADPGALPGWRFAGAAERATALRRAGFVDVELRDRSAEAAERSAQALAAREVLERGLEAAGGDLRRVLAERRALREMLARGALRVVQLLARRA